MGDPLVRLCSSRSQASLPGPLQAPRPRTSRCLPREGESDPGRTSRTDRSGAEVSTSMRFTSHTRAMSWLGSSRVRFRTDRGPRAACTGSVEEGGTRGLRRGGGGESGIRTHGRVSPTHAFQACSFNRSDISPGTKLARSRAQSITGVSAPCAPSAGGPGRWIGPGPPAGGGAPDGLIGPGADDRLNLPPADRGGRPPSRTSAGRSAARTLCNFSLRTASGPEGSSAK